MLRRSSVVETEDSVRLDFRNLKIAFVLEMPLNIKGNPAYPCIVPDLVDCVAVKSSRVRPKVANGICLFNSNMRKLVVTRVAVLDSRNP